MSIANEKTHYTADDLLRLPDGKRFELVDGQLVEKDVGFQSGRIAGRMFFLLKAHCDKNYLGWVLPSEVGYQCFRDDPQRVRKPDVSFIAAGRLPAGEEPQGHCRLAPDLAVEVVSPNDYFSEVTQKAQEYLKAGVRLVWIIDPPTHSVWIRRPDGPGATLGPSDELSGEEVVPGFRCKVDDLFRPPPGTDG
jgi:Uma2 family endonuclease